MQKHLIDLAQSKQCRDGNEASLALCSVVLNTTQDLV